MLSTGSEDLNRRRDQPDVNLIETGFGPLLELPKELAGLGKVRGIHEYSYQIVPEDLTLMLPHAADGLRLARDRSELLAQLEQRVRVKSSGTGRASLNRRGSRISKRRNALLIAGRTFDDERDSLDRQ